MRRLLILTLLLGSLNAQGKDSEPLAQADFAGQITQNRLHLERKNQALLNYLWVDVYAAAFYAQADVSAQQALGENRSKRLELYYFRAIDRADVIKAAWVTLERQHAPAQLDPLRGELDRLHQSFRDIVAGDRYALAYNPEQGLSLERNGTVAFTSRNPALAQAYLGIWLAPDGLSDSLRDTLLAQ